jgi:ceramide glucosyltransferase
MFPSALAPRFLALIGAGLVMAAAGYAGAAVVGVLRGRRPKRGLSPVPPPVPVTVLKPLCGGERRLYENLRTFCVQSHPSFQMLCGVRDPDDPAIEVVRRLQLEFPAVDLQLVIDSRVYGANLKVSNLINLVPHIRHSVLVIADSDIAVRPDYLERVTVPIADPSVGVVTCLYRGWALGGVWTRLGALFINDWFAPSVRVSTLFGSSRFSFGATLALRREVLEAAGGFSALNDVLADDFWLGEFTRRLELRTILSEVVVTSDVIDSSFPALWAHELRWMRTIRAAEPLGFAFTFITFTFPVLAIGCALGREPWIGLVAVAGAAARLALHLLQTERLTATDCLLVPLRDSLSLIEWAAAHFGSRVRWRDHILDAFADRPPPTAPAVRRAEPDPLVPRP